MALNFLALGFMAAGSAISAYGQYQQGRAQAALAESNARLDDMSAIQAKQEAAYDELRHRERVRRLLGTQRAKYGKSGVLMSGSVLDVMRDSIVQGELDALTIRRRGEIQAIRHRHSAEIQRATGRATKRAATTAAIGTLVTGAGNTYLAGKELGTFD